MCYSSSSTATSPNLPTMITGSKLKHLSHRPIFSFFCHLFDLHHPSPVLPRRCIHPSPASSTRLSSYGPNTIWGHASPPSCTHLRHPRPSPAPRRTPPSRPASP